MTFTVPIKVVTSSGDGKLAFDNDKKSSWKAKGKGQFVECFFEKTVNVDKIEIQFAGKDQIYDIYSRNTLGEYELWQQIASKGTGGFEVFDVDKFTNVVSVKITGLNDANEIVDIKFLTEDCNCCKAKCECEEEPDPTPVDDPGRVKNWGSTDKNPNNWKVKQMNDDITKFKVVDKDGVNVADLFNTQEGAQKFIDDAIKVYTPPQPDEPDNPPTPDGKFFTKDGVQLINKPIEIDYKHSNNFRDDGKRFDFNCGSNKNFTNVELIGYFRFKDGKSVDDEVSGKCRGGEHHDGSSPKTYDIGVDIKTGKTRYRTEDKHPEYEKGTAKDTESGKGAPLAGKFIGYKFVCQNAKDGKSVNIQVWQDTGDNEGEKPANAWKLVSNWNVTKPLWLVPPNDHQETIRIDDPGKDGQKDLEAKWLACSGF